MATALLLLFLTLHGEQLNHDASWYLIATSMWLDGGVLYKDIMEINPPLAFYLTVPVVIASKLANVDQTTAFILYIIILTAIALLWTKSIINRLSDLGPAKETVVLLFAILAVVVSPIEHFAEREHFFVILTLPLFTYLSIMDNESDVPKWEIFLLAVFATFGIALKPYFLIPLVLAVLFRLSINRKLEELFNTINLTVFFLCLLYLIASYFLHPQFFSTIMPYGRQIYGYSDNSLSEVFNRSLPGIIFLLLLLYLSLGRISINPIIKKLFGISFGCIIVFLIQQKGWYYHYVPVESYILYTAGWVLTVQWDIIKKSIIRIITLICIFWFLILPSLAHGPYKNKLSKTFLNFTSDIPSANSVLVLSSNVSASFPFANESGLVWGSRWSAQWMIPNSVDQLSTADCKLKPKLCISLNEILDYARNSIIEDLFLYKPDVVFIDERSAKSYFGSQHFDYIEFLQNDDRFSAFWENYTKVDSVFQYSVWSLDKQINALSE